MDLDLVESASQSSVELLNNAGGESLAQLVSRQVKFLDSVKSLKTFDFLRAAAQLCHMDTSLAEQVWSNMFPQLWKILHDRERTVGDSRERVRRRLHRSECSALLVRLSRRS